jgi:hypothetical protein
VSPVAAEAKSVNLLVLLLLLLLRLAFSGTRSAPLSSIVSGTELLNPINHALWPSSSNTFHQHTKPPANTEVLHPLLDQADD